MSQRLNQLRSRFAIGSLLLALLLLPLSTKAAEVFSEYDLLLLDFTLDRQRLAQTVTAYAFNDSIVVSLREAGAALEFPFVIDAQAGTANGWFLSKERRFKLDIGAATVTISGAVQPLAQTDAMVYEDDIYVSIDAFSRWFPVVLKPDLTTMSIEVEPTEPLPVQLRNQRRKLAGQRFVLAPPSLPQVEQPYRLLGPHSADLFLGYHIRRNTDAAGEIQAPQTSLTHSILMRGDLAYMTSAIYLGGNDAEPLSYARLTLSRTAPDTPRGIRLIELGDITPEVVRGAFQANIERGFSITGSTSENSDLYSLDGNRTYISGDVLEGWEVELLQNGIRLDYQVIGAEGRYDFRNLELYNGANTFELIFYGPAGEQRTEVVTRYGGAQSIRKGTLNYRFSTSQKGETVYESPIDVITLSDQTDRGSLRYSGRMEYGLFSSLALTTAWNSLVENGDRLDYFAVGFRAGLRRMSVSLDVTNDPLGGTIVDGVINLPASLRFWGINTQFQHTQYANSVLAKDETDGTKITSRSSVIFSGSYNKLSGRFSAAYSHLVDRSTMVYTADLSRAGPFFRLGNTLKYQVVSDDSPQGRPSVLDSNLYFSSKLDPLTLRGNINYQLEPVSEPRQYQLNADLRVASDMGMKFSLEYTPLNELTRYVAGLNWKLDYATLTPQLTYDSDGRYAGFIFVSFSLAPKPDRQGILIKSQLMANTGAVASRVFLDRDDDGQYSAADKLLPDVEIFAPQLFRHAKTDAQGTAYLVGLRPNKVTDVQLEQSSLPGLSMYSTHEGNSVRPRPGSWARIDFPVTASGEVDGVLYQLSDGVKRPLSGMTVELRDSHDDLIDFKISGYDGFFLFDFVPFGEYRVTLAQEQRDRLVQPAPVFQLNQNRLIESTELVVKAPGVVSKTLFPIEESGNSRSAIIPTTSPVDATGERKLSASESRSYALQLGAYRSKAAAQTAIEQLRQGHRALTQGLSLHVKRAQLGAGGVFFRVYARGGLDEAAARARCDQFQQRGQGCLVVKPSRSAVP